MSRKRDIVDDNPVYDFLKPYYVTIGDVKLIDRYGIDKFKEEFTMLCRSKSISPEIKSYSEDREKINRLETEIEKYSDKLKELEEELADFEEVYWCTNSKEILEEFPWASPRVVNEDEEYDSPHEMIVAMLIHKIRPKAASEIETTVEDLKERLEEVAEELSSIKNLLVELSKKR